MKRLLISFSGGETSAFMCHWLLKNMADYYDEMVVVFANTSQENEETLAFVDLCDRLLFAPLGHRVVWVEAVQTNTRRAGFREVDFNSASRSGDVFEDAVRRYGIFNQKWPACTRELKLRPITAYLRSRGWKKNTYDTAVGIRFDEMDRMSASAEANRIIYPLIGLVPVTKREINAWWAKQGFRLELPGYRGNCKWCWKKSDRKHLTLIGEDPGIYDFPRRMEALYGKVGAEFKRQTDPEYRRTFFRKNRSVDDLFDLFANRGADFVPAHDDARVYDEELDVGGGCGGESCEVWSDEG